jgi:AhpD family alkylhydroperoxidase
VRVKGIIMLSEKEKELIAVGASVAAGCRPCTAHHVRAAREAGACPRGVAVVVETALAVRESATRAMDAWAGECQGERPQLDAAFRAEKRLLAELTAVASAYAVCSEPDLRARLMTAREAGATPEQIRLAIGIAQSIKRVAEEKVAALVQEQPGDAAGCCAGAAPVSKCGCGSGAA